MMILDFEERKRQAQAYLDQSICYFNNFEKFLRTEIPSKAGEMLWGSVATALKALVMAKKGEMIQSHATFWDLSRELARETGDQSYYQNYVKANSFHSNFYESTLTVEDVRRDSADILQLITNLHNLTKSELE